MRSILEADPGNVAIAARTVRRARATARALVVLVLALGWWGLMRLCG